MKKKALLAYGILLIIVFASHAFSVGLFAYVIPLFLMIVPVTLKRRINFSFSARHLLLGIAVSLLILAPAFFWLYGRKAIVPISLRVAMTQLFLVSFPEEVFFRGFLQDTLGNDVTGMVTVSLLFCLSHLPSLIFQGDIYAPLTFFPSLVMGYLYMKTSNTLPSTVFHFLANVLLLVFVI